MSQGRWLDAGNGRKVFRISPPRETAARSAFPCPTLVNDRIEPTWGADGKQYDSLSAYRKTLLPSGNPKGERFIEYDNEPIPTYQAPVFDEAKRVEAIKHAIHDVETGNVPASVSA